MSSTAVIVPVVTVFGLPAVLVVGGLVIGAVAIASLVKAHSEIDRKKGESYLKNYFSEILNDLNNEIKNLNSEWSSELKNDFSNLQNVSDNFIQEFKNQDSLVIRQSLLENMVHSFDSKVSNLKHKLNVTKLDIKEMIESHKQQTKEIKNLFNELDSTVLDGYKNDLNKLKIEFESIEKKSSLKEKNQGFNRFIERVNKFCSEHDFAKSIDFSGFEEEKVNLYINKTPAKNKSQHFKNEIKIFAKKLKDYDSDIYKSIEKLIFEANEESFEQRLEIIKNQVKLKYGQVKEMTVLTNIYKNDLEKAKLLITNYKNNNNLIEEINLKLGNKYINKAEFYELSAKIREFIIFSEREVFQKTQKQELIQNISKSLNILGYEVINNDEESILEKLKMGEILYFDTQWENYKVLVRINQQDEIATRLVKLVASEKDKNHISSYQKQKDQEIAKSWCKDYDKFIESLQKNGIDISVKLRKEPEQEDIQYIVDNKIQKTVIKNVNVLNKKEA